MVIAGIDGCKAGWICAIQDLSNNSITVETIDKIDDVKTLDPAPELSVIDIPIGLELDNDREADLCARKLLGPQRGRSVFPAPIRPVLVASSYLEARNISINHLNKSITIQTWSLLPKIPEFDDHINADMNNVTYLLEGHPEVSFYYMNSNQPMKYKKKSKEGRLERYILLCQEFGFNVNILLPKPKKRFSKDDFYDAMALLWSCKRVHQNEHVSLPQNRPKDAMGIPMCIVG